VLSTAYVLKEQVLESIEQRHADERAFQSTLAEWQAATADSDRHPHWQQFYANALRDALRKANNRRRETLSQMTQHDWRLAVTREMQADLWYTTSSPDEDIHMLCSLDEKAFTPSRNGHGNVPKGSVAVVNGDV
jgi:hypothetical protein